MKMRGAGAFAAIVLLVCLSSSFVSIECQRRPSRPRACCRAANAQCLSCVEGVSEEVYCDEHPDTVGCPLEPIPCCRALNAQCLSCVAGMTEEEYCAVPENQIVAGCPLQPITCCLAINAQCLSCAARMTVEEYCAVPENQFVAGCPQVDFCCEALISSCMACSAGVSEAEYCAENPTTSGCANEEPITDEPDTDTGSNPARGRGRERGERGERGGFFG